MTIFVEYTYYDENTKTKVKSEAYISQSQKQTVTQRRRFTCVHFL